MQFSSTSTNLGNLWMSVKDGFVSSSLAIYHSIPAPVVYAFIGFLVFLAIASFLKELKVFG
jgi:hypothetical protein